MPSPVPVIGGSLLSPQGDLWSAILRDDPTATGNYDEQIYEAAGSREDAKKFEGGAIVPVRQILCVAANGLTAVDAYNFLIANPARWSIVPWGQENEGSYIGGGNYDFSTPIGTIAYAGSACWWQEDQRGTPPEPSGLQLSETDPSSTMARQIQVTQILAPFFVNTAYEIWKVTGHWASGPDYAGAVPSPFPWSNSSDFALVSSGTLSPAQLFVIVTHDTDPPSNCQSGTGLAPPGTIVPPTTNDSQHWIGWGVMNYIHFP